MSTAKPDILFKAIEDTERELGYSSYGEMLDAGTGMHSLTWVASLPTERWVAITVDDNLATRAESSISKRVQDKIIVGNWHDETLLQDEKFDVILVDYLIGSVDGIDPFTQDLILPRLTRHLKPDGRMYLIGMNPIPDHAPYPASLICQMRRLRDVCIMLAGHRPYREYPIDWIRRHLNYAGLEIVKESKLTILHSFNSVQRQLNVGRSKYDLFLDSPSTPSLKQAMERQVDELEGLVRVAMQKAAQDEVGQLHDDDNAKPAKMSDGRIPLSFDYVICAKFNHNNKSSG